MRISLLLSLILCHYAGAGTLSIVTSTTTLKSIVEEVSAGRAKVEAIVKGSSDPHYVEPKPSFMVLTRNADLFIAVGRDLEVGWLVNVLRGARKPELLPGGPRFFDAGSVIEPIEVPEGNLDRAEGDIHPLGNPHYSLDPVRMKKVAQAVVGKLVEVDPEGKAQYLEAGRKFSLKIDQKNLEWGKRLRGILPNGVVTYHKTLNYFLDRYGIAHQGSLEPKPGIPPTAQHVMKLMEMMKLKKVNCVLVESFFELGAAERIQKDLPVHVETVATEVEALPQIHHYWDLIEGLVSAAERCAKK